MLIGIFGNLFADIESSGDDDFGALLSSCSKKRGAGDNPAYSSPSGKRMAAMDRIAVEEARSLRLDVGVSQSSQSWPSPSVSTSKPTNTDVTLDMIYGKLSKCFILNSLLCNDILESGKNYIYSPS